MPVFAQPEFDYIAPHHVVTLAPDQSSATFVVGFRIHETSGIEAQTQGFEMAVSHDPAMLSVEAIDAGEGVLDEEYGEPWFFSTTALPDGWTCTAVYDTLGAVFHAFPVPTVAIDITYSAGVDASCPHGSTLTPLMPGMTTPLTWDNSLSPPLENVVVVGGASHDAVLVDGSVLFDPATYVRGDMNGDGSIDIADAFTAEDYLFLGGADPTCLAALDSNDDHQVDIADIIHLLTYLFLGGMEPAAPFPECGSEPAGSELGCEAYDCP